MTTAVDAPAKLNLALVVGPRREDGKHEVVSLMAPIELADTITLEQADRLSVEGFAADTLVRGALQLLAAETGAEPSWRVTIEKRIPVAAGLGGGSSDAATALRLANDTLPRPLSGERLHALAASLGADVPFFLTPGPKLGRGDGTHLEPISLPAGFHVVLVLPEGAVKRSTAAVYEAFDARSGERGFELRAAALERALGNVDLARLPWNDLATSPLAETLMSLGAFRADVTGAGPVVYGLFDSRARAEAAADDVGRGARVWLTKPAW